MLRRVHTLAGLALALDASRHRDDGRPSLRRAGHEPARLSGGRAGNERRRARRRGRCEARSRRADPRARRRRGDGRLQRRRRKVGRGRRSANRRGGSAPTRRPLSSASSSTCIARCSWATAAASPSRSRRSACLRSASAGPCMLARSLGGASALLKPIRGDAARRWHGELGRAALVGLLLSSLTAAFLAATTFGVIPMPEPEPSAVAASGGPAAPIRTLAGLAGADVADLRQLTFPPRNDPVGRVSACGRPKAKPWSIPPPARRSPSRRRRRSSGSANGPMCCTPGRGAWALALALGLTTAAAPGARRDGLHDLAPQASGKACARAGTRPLRRPTRSFWSAAKGPRPGVSPGRCKRR